MAEVKCPNCGSPAIRMKQTVREVWVLEEEDDGTLRDLELSETIPMDDNQKQVYCPDCGRLWDWDAFEKEYEAARLERILTAAGSIGEDVLDEMVHDAASAMASNINNASTKDQLVMLIEHLGVEDLRDRIAQITEGGDQ